MHEQQSFEGLPSPSEDGRRKIGCDHGENPSMAHEHLGANPAEKFQTGEGAASPTRRVVFPDQEGLTTMEDFIDYDAEDNSRKCHALAVKEIRLDRIRRGLSHPRPHVPAEVIAWREGVIARTAIFGAVVASFIAVGLVAAISQENPPAVKIRAASAGAP